MVLEKNVTNFIKSNCLISNNSTIVLGVSGGPDSVALVHILHNINQEQEALGWNFHIAHLNHKLRGSESDKDAAFVKGFAYQLNLSVSIKEVDVIKVSKESKLTIEEAARIERYKFLENCAEEISARHVAVAHTADDNIETVLHRIIRGTGLQGLCGISPNRPISTRSNITLIRPLLDIWKKDVLEYLQTKDILFRIDSSNLQNDHLRNKIRLELLPMLKENYNNQIKRSISNLSKIFKENYSLIEDLSLSLQNNAILAIWSNKCILDNQALLKAPEIVQQKVLHDILSNLGVPLKHVGFQKYKSIIKLIKDGKNHESFHLSKKSRVHKADGKLFIEILDEDQLSKINEDQYQKQSLEKFGEVELTVPGITELSMLDSRIEAKVVENENGFLERFKASKTMNEEPIDMAKVDLPLHVRLRKPGDRFWPIGSKGIKKIKDFFIDIKVPRHERDRIPIVTSKHSPIWVTGLRLDNRVKISDATKKVVILRYLPNL